MCSLACLNVAFSIVVTFFFFFFFLVASICWKSLFVCVYLVVGFFFLKKQNVTLGKNLTSRESGIQK